ncbi:carboxypeptidase M32 [Chachezhania antarctica]|uniref:carboxypeptidase M32 n=1 Tax=Chachezhania antarctica TaxID=2340860 RepID=UPI000EAB4F95|nr:carboxypeptidase M32 [Chachezhania antarctica]|tara:strand:+ start:5926 stop:7401 length:1476 start_codon:yes stop_codon:yes gene_type:complete
MTAYNDLMTYQRDTEALKQVAMRLGWDQETVMPRGAAAQRSAEMAAMESVLHARQSDPRVADWLENALAPDPAGEAQLRDIRRNYDRATKVPADLATAIARQTSLAQGIWAKARSENDPTDFHPVLAEIIRLRQEEGAALADGTDMSVYDALLSDYEPGTSAAEIGTIFDAMRVRLVALRSAILEKPEPPALSGDFDLDQQMVFSNKVAEVFGYDFTRGRIDRAVHPFSSGSGSDVRITTRTQAADPLESVFSTIHETGHATYEMSVDPAFALTVLGRGVSMGVHESQSRIYENQLGRSRAFSGWLFDRMTSTFGDIGVSDADGFFAAANRVASGYIRTAADEVQYNLHIMLRFDLERALIAGDLKPADLEGAWNDRFLADFGFAVDKPSNGFLQDVHWSVGLFGYFPTYALGNVYAGCLHEALRKAVPTLDNDLARGDTMAARSWLKEHVQRHGSLYEPRDLIERATGAAPSEGPLLDYLEGKFGALYGL